MDIDMRTGELFPASAGARSAAPSSGGTTPLGQPGQQPCYVAIGDSFTEGMNDPDPAGGFRGWADRLAVMLAAEYPELRYANLAIRGKLLRQIVHDQVPEALELLAANEGPGLVSLAGGGNDILRPGADPDTLADLFDSAVARLRASGCQVLMFTGFDPKAFALMRMLRGRIAAYNMHLRAIADERDCYLVDLWSMRFLREPGAWSPDRLHLNSSAHQRVALRAAEVLGVPVTDDWRASPAAPPAAAAPAAAGRPLAVVPGAGPLAGAPAAASASLPVRVPVWASASARAAWLAARREDARWAKEYFVPWISRRLHGTSSGDEVSAKRPALQPVTPA
jgi:lysophospholipase L1-like esterase